MFARDLGSARRYIAMSAWQFTRKGYDLIPTHVDCSIRRLEDNFERSHFNPVTLRHQPQTLQLTRPLASAIVPRKICLNHFNWKPPAIVALFNSGTKSLL